MKTKDGHLFPLAKFLVEIQQKKLGFTISQLIIFSSSDKKLEMVGGFYDHKSKTIGLNIANLYLFRGKYELKGKLRVAAAIVLEECYHAANHGGEFNTEDEAAFYGATEAAKLPEEFLIAQGGQLYKEITLNKKEKKKMKLGDIPVTIIGGSMFEFVNKVKEMPNAEKETQYGHITLKNDRHVSTISITTDIAKLDVLKKAMGNTSRASVEYAGVIYVYDVENGGWKTYIDADEHQMVEIGINETLNVSLTKHEDGEHLEAFTVFRSCPVW
ncbi:MAG: hypothetical protein U9R15_04505 [Chloroflexota bacterium]|nr:hypothetical protein [Chloroflexota bacterium]